jgi:hypothetical protein
MALPMAGKLHFLAMAVIERPPAEISAHQEIWRCKYMLTLLLGFIGIVLLPALILSLIMSRFCNYQKDFPFQEDNLRFKITTDPQR